jgi:hypothetical protein
VISEWLAKGTVVAVVVTWVITSLVLPVVVHGYTPPAEVGTVMGVVAGAAVAVIFARSRNGKNGKNDTREAD